MFTYSMACHDDLPDLINLYRGYLNDGEAIDDYIRSGMASEGYLAVKCVCDGKIIGVISAKPGLDFTCGHQDLVKSIYDKWGCDGIYCGEMLAVLPQYRKMGIAKALTQKLAEALSAVGARYLVLEEWHRSVEDDIPATGIVKYLGNAETVCVDKNFYKDIAKFGLSCPECGKICHCGAKVIIITLSN